MRAPKSSLCTQLLVILAVFSTPTTIESVRLNIRGSNSTYTSGKQYRAPHVYFLFLAVDKISNLAVWKAFFANAPSDQYRAYVHCKLPQCQQQVQGSALQVVPTVSSYYCTDLVSPMHQLVAHALTADAGTPSHYADKFVYISDSTLPAKPFSSVYGLLTQRRGSDFCIFPSSEWADIPSASGGMEIAVKHHQWITLERSHAETASALWVTGKLHEFMNRFRMNQVQYAWSNNSFADGRNFGCLDEFWHMAAVYGTLNHADAARIQHMHLPLFTGSPLQVSPTVGWQGECDTFVIWSKYLHIVGPNPFERMYSSLDYHSLPHAGNIARPGWWDTISQHGMVAMRNSGFLFVRKFVDNPRLTDGPNFHEAFIRLVVKQ